MLKITQITTWLGFTEFEVELDGAYIGSVWPDTQWWVAKDSHGFTEHGWSSMLSAARFVRDCKLEESR